jgi:hypothetical protein
MGKTIKYIIYVILNFGGASAIGFAANDYFRVKGHTDWYDWLALMFLVGGASHGLYLLLVKGEER